MLSKCANPDCNTTLQYLREGKVFKVESGSDAPFLVDQAKSVRRVEHFWLCGPCSESWTLLFDKHNNSVNVVVKPLSRRAAAS